MKPLNALADSIDVASTCLAIPPVLLAHTADRNENAQYIELGDLRIYVLEHRVEWLGRYLGLSEKEFQLLATLAQPPGKAWSFESLYENVWAAPFYGDAVALKSAVKRLRTKLRANAIRELIETIPGYGYRLDAQSCSGVNMTDAVLPSVRA